MEKKVFKKGSVIFREGDIGTTFFQIASGTAGVYSHYGEADERKLTEMQPGQYFGEMAVIEAWPRSSTIVAEEDLHVIEISEKELNAYFAEQPDRILALMKQLSKRIRELTADYDEVKAFVEDKTSIQPEKKSGFLAKLKSFLASNSSADTSEPTEEELMQQNAVIGKEGAVQPVTSYKKGQIIFRQGDDRFQIIVLDDEAAGVALARPGVAGEERRAVVDFRDPAAQRGGVFQFGDIVQQKERHASRVVIAERLASQHDVSLMVLLVRGER